jgi:hypothetical protein
MEENNNQQQYQQYQAPQQPQGTPQGNQMFQGFKAPNTEEGLKKKFADLKTIFLILGILAAIGVVIDLVTVIPAIQVLSSPYARLLGMGGLAPVLIILVIVDIAFCAIQWVGMVMAKKEDKKALILGIVAGGIELLIVVVCLCTGSGFKWFNAIMGGALIADCILTLNSYKAVRGNN